MNAACPYCGKTLRIPDNCVGKEGKCPNCSRTLLVSPEGVKAKQLCTEDKEQGFAKSISTEREVTENGGKNPDTVLQVVSFLMPLIGFILGIVFVTKPSQAEKNTGKRCLTLAVMGSIAAGIIFWGWMGMVTGEIDEVTTAELRALNSLRGMVTGEIDEVTTKFEREIKRIETTCMICDGRGQVDCPMCVNGVSTNPVTGKKETCSFCNGQGVTTCTFCDGTGRPK